MRLYNPWTPELWRVSGLLAFALLLGLIFGEISTFLLGAVLVYLGYHLLQLFRFERWLRGKQQNVPDITGIWGEIYHHFYRLRRRNRKRKRKLTSIVKRFRESTAAMPDATVVLRDNGIIEWWNDAAERVFSFKHPHDTGQMITNLVRHPTFLEFMGRGEFDEAVEIPAPGRDDQCLRVRVIPYGKNQRLVVARDVTRMRLLEQMRRDFIANVSHELRTPLTVLAGYLETLRDSDDQELEKWRRSFDSMQQQTARMQQLVSDLLLLARLESEQPPQQPDAVDVPAMLGMIREDASALSNDQHSIALVAEADLWLNGSPEELRSAFSNLLYNAVRYTPVDGRIDVRWFAGDDGAVLEVRDTGVGIAPQHLPRLTERFYRVDVGRSRAAGGTGLGLAIVKHVLARHQGRLEIDSELGKGSCFRCFFPESVVVRQTPAQPKAS